MTEPPLGIPQGAGSQTAPVNPPIDLPRDEASPFQDADMSGNGGKGHLERLGELSHHGRPSGELCQQSPSGLVAESTKDQVEVVGL
jgi:hypothetical protein